MAKNNRRAKCLAGVLLVSSSLSSAATMLPQIAYASNNSQEDQWFQAYANSQYTYCDAKMVAALWGEDAYRGKIEMGAKILGGHGYLIEERFADSRQRGNACNFDETDFTYDDAQNLSATWASNGGSLSVWDAKTKIAAFVTAGQGSQIREQMSRSYSQTGY